MKLYYFETPHPRKPCAIAKYLDAPVEYHRVDLSKGEHQSPEYLAINPNGKVPALVDGDVRLWESHAIMIHLAQKAGSDLWPSDPAKQLEIMQWLIWDCAHFTRHAAALLFENYMRSVFQLGDPNQATIEESTGFFTRFAGVLDSHLEGRKYVVGDQLSIADFGLAVILPQAKEAKLPLGGYKEISRWHESMMEIEAWRDPFPAAA